MFDRIRSNLIIIIVVVYSIDIVIIRAKKTKSSKNEFQTWVDQILTYWGFVSYLEYLVAVAYCKSLDQTFSIMTTFHLSTRYNEN